VRMVPCTSASPLPRQVSCAVWGNNYRLGPFWEFCETYEYTLWANDGISYVTGENTCINHSGSDTDSKHIK